MQSSGSYEPGWIESSANWTDFVRRMSDYAENSENEPAQGEKVKNRFGNEEKIGKESSANR